MLKAMCIYPVCSKHNKGTLHLPVVVVTTEETASAHVDVLLNLLVLSLSTDGLKNGLDILSLLR